jgi:hypothetical protein
MVAKIVATKEMKKWQISVACDIHHQPRTRILKLKTSRSKTNKEYTVITMTMNGAEIHHASY